MSIYKVEYRQNEKSHFFIAGYFPDYDSANEKANQLLKEYRKNRKDITVLITME